MIQLKEISKLLCQMMILSINEEKSAGYEGRRFILDWTTGQYALVLLYMVPRAVGWARSQVTGPEEEEGSRCQPYRRPGATCPAVAM